MVPARRSITLPIGLASAGVVIVVALLIGWILIFVHPPNVWVLVGGIASLGFLIAVLVLFGVFLVRRIQEVNRQTTFVDSVTHELKSPLTSLKLALDTLDRDGLQPVKRREIRTMMRDDVERLTDFVDHVLEASRLADPERDRSQVRSIRVAELVDACTTGLVTRYGPAAERVVNEVPATLTVRADPEALETVLRNLVDNALKYSPADEPVTVGVRRTDRVLALEVRDRGIGMRPEHLRRAFERFYRAPDGREEARRGTGLGLYVASELVRAEGGRLEASSEGTGRGTTFAIRLPRDRWHDDAPAQPTVEKAT